MSNEADKVINLSLCKMAESRTTRRGGSSLHKHLLIASVLTKATRARSAFLDTWYIGDDGGEGVDLNLSYQEADFPSEELDSTVGMADHSNRSMLDMSMNSSTGNNARLASEVESDIDLPPDILHCVEKLGDLNSRMFASQQSSASLSETATNGPACTNLEIPDVLTSAQPTVSKVSEAITEDAQLSTTLTYLDLDAGSSTTVERGPAATSTPAKRRREWCFEDEEEDDQIVGDGNGSYCIETPIKPQQSSSKRTSFGKKCKRLRFDDDSGVSSPEKTLDETGVPSGCADNDSFKAGSFRLTYEDVDGDDSDDDSFLEDALSESLPSPSQVQLAKTRDRNDRRVPSASSSSGSCSGSDEDGDGEGENSMEVDQITNLVQFISFNKQSQAQNSTNLRSISCVN